MNKSESIKEIAIALAKAQGAMSGAKKGSVNPHFKSNYADLASVIEAIKLPFTVNGLSYIQMPSTEGNMVSVETVLMHSSGEWISSILTLPMGKLTAHGAGAAITYARRFSLQAIAGVPSEDDDGNSISIPQQQHSHINDAAVYFKPQAAKPTPPAKPISIKQQQDIVNALNVAEMSAADFCKSAKINALSELPENRFNGAIAHLKSKAIENEV